MGTPRGKMEPWHVAGRQRGPEHRATGKDERGRAWGCSGLREGFRGHVRNLGLHPEQCETRNILNREEI